MTVSGRPLTGDPKGQHAITTSTDPTPRKEDRT